MSNTFKRPFDHMIAVAEALAEKFEPHCERVEIAGSLRRKAAQVGDIELICQPTPRVVADLLGNETIDGYSLFEWMDSCIADGSMRHTSPKRWGQKLRSLQFVTTTQARYKADLFVQLSPETWGVNHMIRTGSADFSRRMVTPRSQGGYMPNGWSVKDARLHDDSGAVQDTPEEAQIFELYGMDFVKPEARA